MVERWNMRCVTVADAESALNEMRRAEAQGEAFGVAIVDINLPGMDGFELAAEIQKHVSDQMTAVVLITAAGVRGDAGRCRELGLSGYLTKPVEAPLLLHVMRSVLSRPTGAALVTRHEPRPRPTPLKILLAEDNAVNRRVATKLVEREGHVVVAVEDGAAAVRQLESERFDLVLMDIEMPVLDGFEATAQIRYREEITGERVPIIALTAHAVSGFRDQCLARGMDGYLSKPIQLEQMIALIQEIAAPTPAP
jgi:CheY-like chemotaxis protein